jgi:hypothetical protein
LASRLLLNCFLAASHSSLPSTFIEMTPNCIHCTNGAVKGLLNPIQNDGQEWKIAIRPHNLP